MIIFVTFLLMRLSGIECTLKEVTQRRYESQNAIPQITFTIDITDDKCDFIKTKSNELKDRKDGIDTKARTLLTLTSLILGLVSSTTGIASAKSVGILSIIPLIFLFITIFLLTRYFSIDKNYSVDYSFLLTVTESAKKNLYNEVLECQYYNNLVADFLVDLYRSSLRYFVVGMLFIMTLGIWNISSVNSSSISTAKNQVLQSLKVFINDIEQNKNIEKEIINFHPDDTIKSQSKSQLTEP